MWFANPHIKEITLMTKKFPLFDAEAGLAASFLKISLELKGPLDADVVKCHDHQCIIFASPIV